MCPYICLLLFSFPNKNSICCCCCCLPDKFLHKEYVTWVRFRLRGCCGGEKSYFVPHWITTLPSSAYQVVMPFSVSDAATILQSVEDGSYGELSVIVDNLNLNQNALHCLWNLWQKACILKVIVWSQWQPSWPGFEQKLQGWAAGYHGGPAHWPPGLHCRGVEPAQLPCCPWRPPRHDGLHHQNALSGYFN